MPQAPYYFAVTVLLFFCGLSALFGLIYSPSADLGKNLLTLCGPLATLAGFCFAIAQFSRGEDWRKTEFLAKVVNDFHGDKDIQKALRMLDWNSRIQEVFPAEPEVEYRYVSIDHSLLISALRCHDLQNASFAAIESNIRDTFDRLFDHMDKIKAHIDAGAVDSVAGIQHLQYYLDLATGKRAQDNAFQRELALAVWQYSEQFFPLANKLLDKPAIDSRVTAEFRKLQQQLAAHTPKRSELVPARWHTEISKSEDATKRTPFDEWRKKRETVIKGCRAERVKLLKEFHDTVDFGAKLWKPM